MLLFLVASEVFAMMVAHFAGFFDLFGDVEKFALFDRVFWGAPELPRRRLPGATRFGCFSLERSILGAFRP